MQTRNPDSVLPEPVGAATSVSSPLAIAGQAPTCGGVGPSGNRRSNHVRTAGWKLVITAYDFATVGRPNISSTLPAGPRDVRVPVTVLVTVVVTPSTSGRRSDRNTDRNERGDLGNGGLEVRYL